MVEICNGEKRDLNSQRTKCMCINETDAYRSIKMQEVELIRGNEFKVS